jgi:hypothetical protein
MNMGGDEGDDEERDDEKKRGKFKVTVFDTTRLH